MENSIDIKLVKLEARFDSMDEKLSSIPEIHKSLQEITKILNSHHTDVELLKKDINNFEKDLSNCRSAIYLRIEKLEKHLEQVIEPKIDEVIKKQEWLLGKVSAVVAIVTIFLGYVVNRIL